ncbi:MAG: hypothetical protein K0U41_09940 [Gammaproteobacteria bacterium]|nr:hypothetical protein [Gammaproteobacteria bacterium]
MSDKKIKLSLNNTNKTNKTDKRDTMVKDTIDVTLPEPKEVKDYSDYKDYNVTPFSSPRGSILGIHMPTFILADEEDKLPSAGEKVIFHWFGQTFKGTVFEVDYNSVIFLQQEM